MHASRLLLECTCRRIVVDLPNLDAWIGHIDSSVNFILMCELHKLCRFFFSKRSRRPWPCEGCEDMNQLS
uniref:Uncharacterized protein n=1 Tax=Arundo donax TaxID=35708 RepID=A0A0A9U8E6_ARUDO